MAKLNLALTLVILPLLSFAQYDVVQGLEGRWINENDSSKAEVWEKTEAGFKGKATQILKDGTEKVWESLRIYNNDGVLTYEANVVGNPAPVGFAMSFANEKEIMFSNEGHDFPKHIHYRFLDENHLRVEVYADKNGKKLIFKFRRA